MFEPARLSAPRPTEQATQLGIADARRLDPTPLRDAVPDRIDRYRLGDRLGDGGTGTVHASVDPSTLQQLAIKVMRRDRVGHRGAWLAFEREAALLGSLDHPHVPQLIDRGVTDDGRLWIAMERVEGQTLSRALSTGRYLDEAGRHELVRDVLLPAFVEICDVIAWGHRRGWLHRDLKPSNILLGSDGHAHVIDWGLARPLGEELPERRRGVTGTPGYIAPEHLESGPRRAEERTDVFALGVILYEILTFERAFGWAKDRETLTELMALAPAPPALLEPGLPGIDELSRVCMEAISSVAERRPSLTQLGAAVAAALEPAPVQEGLRRAS